MGPFRPQLAASGSDERVLHLEIGQPSTGAPEAVKQAAIRAVPPRTGPPPPPPPPPAPAPPPAPRPPRAARRSCSPRQIQTDQLGYTGAAGIAPLREAIAAHYQAAYAVEVAPEEVAPAPSRPVPPRLRVPRPRAALAAPKDPA